MAVENPGSWTAMFVRFRQTPSRLQLSLVVMKAAERGRQAATRRLLDEWRRRAGAP
jgi:hypothetical protein